MEAGVVVISHVKEVSGMYIHILCTLCKFLNKYFAGLLYSDILLHMVTASS